MVLNVLSAMSYFLRYSIQNGSIINWPFFSYQLQLNKPLKYTPLVFKTSFLFQKFLKTNSIIKYFLLFALWAKVRLNLERLFKIARQQTTQFMIEWSETWVGRFQTHRSKNVFWVPNLHITFLRPVYAISRKNRKISSFDADMFLARKVI